MSKFRTLKSLFHEDEGRWQRVYQERFCGEGTLHYPFSIGKYPAFSVLTAEMVLKGDAVRNLQIQLERLEAEIPCKQVILMDSLFREIEQSNEIEGVRSSRRDLALALNAKPGTRFAGQLRQYDKLLSGNMEFPRTPAGIRKLYDDMLLLDIVSEDPGNAPDGMLFRAGPVFVTNGQKTIHTGIMPEPQIMELMEQSLTLVQDAGLPFLSRTAVFHFLFGYIHPFYDGNGRLNRFLTSLLISKELSVLSSLQLSLAFRGNRKKYYREFEEAEDRLNRGDLTPFILMFLEVLEESLANEVTRLEERQAKYTEYLAVLGKTGSKTGELVFLEAMLAATLFSVDGVTKKQLMELTGRSSSWINNVLRENRDKLESVREGHENLYRFNEQYLDSLLKTARERPDQHVKTGSR